MMQLTESIPLPLHPSSLGLCLDAAAASAKPPQYPWSAGAWPAPSKPSSGGALMNSASCMEQLLVHCAHAIDRDDATLAHQIFWVLNTIAPPDGDSTQRLASSFLRALLSRCHLSSVVPPPPPLHRFSPLDLASFLDLTRAVLEDRERDRGQEGAGRVERPEPRGRWAQRMRGSGFRGVGFGEEAAAEVKGMLDEHAAGWGLKKEDDHHLVLTWKGHNVVFATAWVPALL